MAARRFPPPWDIEEANASCFIVKDNNGQALAYVYFESDPGRRTAANLLTCDEARRIAANIAKLPERAKARAICLAADRCRCQQAPDQACQHKRGSCHPG